MMEGKQKGRDGYEMSRWKKGREEKEGLRID